MCRLVAYIGEPLEPGRLIFEPPHSLAVQSYRPGQMLSGVVNADGYGAAWYVDGRPIRVAHCRPIWHDTDLPHLLRSVASPVFIGAVRCATEGIPIDEAGLQPMLFGPYAFALNGYVGDFRKRLMRRMRAELPDHLYAELRGATDTETLQLLTVHALQKGATRVDALAEVAAFTLELCRERGLTACLNLLLADGNGVAVTRLGTEPETNSLFVAERPTASPQGITIASEPFDDDPAWRRVEPGTITDVTANGVEATQLA